MKQRELVFAFVLAALGGTAFAQAPAADATATPRIDKREARQDKRIRQGVDSGQLTARESARLAKQQGRIESAEAKAKSDGKVTPEERAKLTRMQNRANRDIRRQKHDAQHS